MNNLEDLITVIGEATRECTTIIRSGEREKPYWWNIDIENQRAKCLRMRRAVTRANARNAPGNEENIRLQMQYKDSCKELKRLIFCSKREHWKNLCSELENDVWGAGYKIAMKHLGSQSLPYNLSLDQKTEIIEYLFPKREDQWIRGEPVQEGVPPFTMDELAKAAEQIKHGKAPGPDRVPPEAVKLVAKIAPLILLAILNTLLGRQEFPEIWKIASVSLIWKGGTIDLPSSFRPICMLSMIGKFYERLIKDRIETEVEQKGGLSHRQFGFRKGRSAIQAINVVVDAAKNTNSRWFAVIAVDVQNAFNSATWSKIVEELYNRGISQYLINVVESYFSNREIRISNVKSIEMSAGVPQGSVLGPLLWNILYDQVLALRLTEGATSIAYADDLALMVEATDDRELEFRVNESLARINTWMDRTDLTIAPQKTKAIILKGPRKRDHVQFEILGTRVVPVRQLKYLGVILDDRLTFGKHVKQTVEKAQVKMAALTRILPNIGGPSGPKREVLCGVIQSTVLYGAPVWQQVTRIQKYKNALLSIQRKALLRIASGYRTISTSAIQVVTGIPPINLLAEERHRLYHAENAHLPTVKRRERETTLNKWQEIWNNHTDTAAWTKTLIRDLLPWVRCEHKRLDFFVTQFLTGHGYFRYYLKRMAITQDDICMYCGDTDTAEHTVLVCDRWSQWRQELEEDLEVGISRENIISVMLRNGSNWRKVCCFVKKVLQKKRAEEREMEQVGN